MANFSNTTIAALDDVLSDLALNSAGELEVIEAAPLTIVPIEPENIMLPAIMSEREQFYSGLPKQEVDELLATADRIRDHASKSMIEIGTELIRIKTIFTGRFDQWLRLEFPLSKSTAWNMINAVQRFGDMPKVIEHLPQGTVYKLAANATPEGVRQSIVREIIDGADLNGTEVERRIEEAKEIERTRRAAEREKAEDEREQGMEDQRWREREKELKDAGKTDVEIGTVRKAWSTAKERKARAKQDRERAALRRAEKFRKDQEELHRTTIDNKKRASEAVEFLRERLGDDFSLFRSMLADNQSFWFGEALRRWTA